MRITGQGPLKIISGWPVWRIEGLRMVVKLHSACLTWRMRWRLRPGTGRPAKMTWEERRWYRNMGRSDWSPMRRMIKTILKRTSNQPQHRMVVEDQPPNLWTRWWCVMDQEYFYVCDVGPGDKKMKQSRLSFSMVTNTMMRKDSNHGRWIFEIFWKFCIDVGRPDELTHGLELILLSR